MARIDIELKPVMAVQVALTFIADTKQAPVASSSVADELLKYRFAVIQAWRPVRSPIEAQPLAICDARTIDPTDLVKMERRRPDRVGETYQLAHGSNQHWIYFPLMTDNEVLVFKTCDSDMGSTSRFTAHASFGDLTSPPDAPGRVSIEVRALVFFGPA